MTAQPAPAPIDYRDQPQKDIPHLGPILADPLLSVLADQVTRIEDLRKALSNQLGVLVRPTDVLDEDGVSRGHGMSTLSPEIADIDALIHGGGTVRKKIEIDGTPRVLNLPTAGVTDIEAAAIKALQKRMRTHPLWRTYGATAKASGIGEKQLARLLGAISDPFWNGGVDDTGEFLNRPRTISELWSYCGMSVIDGAAPKRKAKELDKWSPAARMRIYLISAQCIITGKATDDRPASHYRHIYDQGRVKYANATHPAPCVRCGPSKKPALPGSPLSDAHKHARAIRLISKEILRDLWLAACDLHEAEAIRRGLI